MKTLFQRPDRVEHPLYVVTPVFNSQRYRTRWKLYQDFAKRCEEAGAILYTIECAFGDRKHVITEEGNPRHVQVRSNHELWIKENLINLCVARLPADWQYVGIVDSDVRWARDDWADETIHQLQRYKVVQMWSEALDMSPDHEVMTRFRSFIWCWRRKLKAVRNYHGEGKVRLYHPGYAWSWTRFAWNALGGMPDWAVLGGGDLYAARALTGMDRTLPRSLGQSGKRLLKAWQDRADTFIKQDVGCVDGTILHFWHGKKQSRKYLDRGQILVDAHFEPDVDLYRDWQGLYQLHPGNVSLRDGIRDYFAGRNEDGVDL